MKTQSVTLAAFAGATLLAAASASAASIFGGGLNNLIYHNYENVFDSTGAQKLSTIAAPATLVVGDTIVGVLRIDQIQHSDGSAAYSNSNGVDEITGIFAQKIVAIVGSTVYFDKPTLTTFHKGADSFTTGLTGNEMFAFYHGTGATADFLSGVPLATTMALSVASATDGAKLFTLGYVADANPTTFTGDTGYFYSNLSLDGSGHPQSQAFGGLNIIANPMGVQTTKIDDPGENFTTLVANGGNGSGIFNVDMWFKSSIGLDFVTGNPNVLNVPWDFLSSDPTQVNVTVPMPAAAWTGMSMLAVMGAIAMRRRNAGRRA